MENLDFGTILTLVLAALSTFFGVFWGKVKGKLGQIVSLVKEIYEAAEVMEKALEDNKITSDELKSIKSNFNDVKVKFKELVGK